MGVRAMKRVFGSFLATCLAGGAIAVSLSAPASAYPLLTNVPDIAFEQRLIDLGHDDVLDELVRTTTIRQITSLDLRSDGY
jgi:hypothetical protein